LKAKGEYCFQFSSLTGSLLNLKVHKSGKKTQGLELQIPWPVI
jgi:hypothetical protein